MSFEFKTMKRGNIEKLPDFKKDGYYIMNHHNCEPGECGGECKVADCGIKQGYDRPTIMYSPVNGQSVIVEDY